MSYFLSEGLLVFVKFTLFLWGGGVGSRGGVELGGGVGWNWKTHNSQQSKAFKDDSGNFAITTMRETWNIFLFEYIAGQESVRSSLFFL